MSRTAEEAVSSRLPPFFQNHCRGQTGTYASSALVESCESRLCNYSRFDRQPLCTGPVEDRGGRTAIQYLLLHVPWRQPGELRSGFRSAPPHRPTTVPDLGIQCLRARIRCHHGRACSQTSRSKRSGNTFGRTPARNKPSRTACSVLAKGTVRRAWKSTRRLLPARRRRYCAVLNVAPTLWLATMHRCRRFWPRRVSLRR